MRVMAGSTYQAKLHNWFRSQGNLKKGGGCEKLAAIGSLHGLQSRSDAAHRGVRPGMTTNLSMQWSTVFNLT